MMGPGEAEVGQDVTPRINGDGTITLIVTARLPTESQERKQGPSARDDRDGKAPCSVPEITTASVVIGMRRVASGQATAIALPRQGVALWIRPTLLPENADAAPGK